MVSVDEHTLPGIVEESLARIGTLLDTLFETAEDAIFLMDGLRFVDCNPATLRMFGCRTKDEIVGQTPIHFSPVRQPGGAESAELAGHLVAAAIDGKPQQFEWRHRRLDHTEFEVEVRLHRCVVDGMPFLIAVVRDITERKRADAAIRRQVLAGALVNRTLSRCASCTPDQFDAQMDSALRDLAGFLGADHAFFLMASPDRDTYSCTHETCASGVAPLCPKYQNVPAGTDAWLDAIMLGGKTARIASLEDDPEAERWAASADVGCRSLLHVPTSGPSGEFAGAIGVDSHSRQVQWSENEITLCAIIGNALTGLTERKRAIDRLLQEKQFSERLIDSLPGIFYLYDSDLRLRRWNRTHHEEMGYSAKQMRGMRIENWFGTEESRRQAIATARAILHGGGAAEFAQLELLHKDGSVVPYICSGVRIDTPDGPMLLGVGINVAARLQAERALAASQRNYRALFDAPNDALFVLDQTGRVLDVNQRACTTFAVDPSRARGLSIDDLSLGEPPYSGQEALEMIHRAVKEGPQVFDWQSRRGDGTVFWSEVALRAFQTEGEERVIASVRDITERKLAGLERERLMAEAQAASSAKDQFLAVLSHELRNPLAAIQAGVGLLRRVATFDEPRLLHATEVIERNVRLQARLVNDLLDLSRLVRGKLEIHRALAPLDDLVISAVQTCQSDAARAEVSLETHADSGLRVDVDGDRIQQVVINLVSNAIKFTPKGGRVMVSVAARDDRAQIVVEDTGIGIEADRLMHMFDMFAQGRVDARRAAGLGIGLALVKSIVELHAGRVWAESGGPGRGSRFTVELPMPAAPGLGPEHDNSRSSPAPIKILLVEDNTDTRTLLAETFTEFSYQVVSAESAEAALDLLARERVDVILADIGLPGMDGYEFLRRARRLPIPAEIPAFALTGYGQESDVRKSREAGYAEHFVKPIDVEAIDQCIRSRVRPSSA
jgi:PAS domain S-box-containing protein